MTSHGRTTVPEFVGMPVHVPIDEAADRRILLTGQDLDGPGLHAQTWPGLYWVTGQDVAPGTAVENWTRVVVTYIAEGGTRSGVSAEPLDPLPSLSQHAEPDDEALPAEEKSFARPGIRKSPPSSEGGLRRGRWVSRGKRPDPARARTSAWRR